MTTDPDRRDAAISALATILAEDETGLNSAAIRWLAVSTSGVAPAIVARERRDRDRWHRIKREYAHLLGCLTDDELAAAADAYRRDANEALEALRLVLVERNALAAIERAA